MINNVRWNVGRVAVAAVALTASLSQALWSSEPLLALEPPQIDELRELVIVHPAVVDPYLNGLRSHNGGPGEAAGPWSLRGLLELIASDQTPSGRNAFYASFFEQWLTTQTADNGVSIPARDPQLVESLLLDQFSSIDPATGLRVFELWKAPFELIAIAYRPDLSSADGSDPGELRFVYKLVGPSGEDLKFTLNMEYALPKKALDGSPWSAVTWANNFHRLGAKEIGSPAYLSLLQGLTQRVTSPTQFPGSGGLRHIRTNELAFGTPGAPWQLREFVTIRPSFLTRRVIASSVDDTPARSFNDSTSLSDFIAANPVLGTPGTDFMKLRLPEEISIAGTPTKFLDGASDVGIRWKIPEEPVGQPSVSVDNFGLLTCNGCHQDNKSIAGDHDFYHVRPDIEPGQLGTSRLSKFLTQADPNKADRRPGELNRRKAELARLLELPWTPLWLTP